MIAQRHDCRSNSPFITNFFILLILTPFLGRVTHTDTHTQQPLFTSHPIPSHPAGLCRSSLVDSRGLQDTSTRIQVQGYKYSSCSLRVPPGPPKQIRASASTRWRQQRSDTCVPDRSPCRFVRLGLVRSFAICTVSILILISHVTGPGRRDVQASSKARVSLGPVHLLGNYFVLTRKREKEKEEEEERDREREHARWR